MYHINLNLKLPKSCKDELLQTKEYYGLVLNNKVSQETRERYYTTSMGHAFRSYSTSPKDAYNLNHIKPYMRTSSWNKIPLTTEWLVNNLCDEEDLGLVCLHKITAGGWVDWHSHYPDNLQIVHFSLITNEDDLSEVKDDEIYSMNYPECEGYIFNSYLQHRSTNFSDYDRIHLVVECSPNNERFQALYN